MIISSKKQGISPKEKIIASEQSDATSEKKALSPEQLSKPSEQISSQPSVNANNSDSSSKKELVEEIIVEGVSKTYSKRKVADCVSLNIRKGEIVGLLGPNGAGKTTTFYMVVGLIKPDTGKILFNNQNVTKMSMYQRARLGIGYLPQEASVFRKLSVRDNIMVILENIEISAKERKERLDKLIDELGINRIADSMGFALSGGERRRVEIARALAAEPSFILLDEPFAGVDPIAVQDIQSIVLQLQRKGLGLLITDHNVRETLAIVDRAYIMNLGKILVSGTADFVAADETARKFYLGDRFQLDQIQKN
ncbi:MAG: LPS export ABC transporter ATP-binding protein [Candidatus Riflebacteria bacterium]|nr:LPS export ABC transporter ATP-binding protein [Candidatus Riflebacteria bacterium]